MGLIRDTIGTALGADKIKTGFGGTQLPFINTNKDLAKLHSNAIPPSYDSVVDEQSDHYNDISDTKPAKRSPPPLPPRQLSPSQALYRPSNGSFRPVVLPQIAHGDGQPFLRAYSDELAVLGISQDQLISLIDTINVAIIPNPEVQIFQKAASIAGWFIPGSASLGLMAGQFAVGIGAAFGHSSMVAKALAKANLATFLPRGLEICIAKTHHVDEELHCQSAQSMDDTSENRLASYGDRIASLSIVLSPLGKTGRRDPLAVVGKAIGDQNNNRKLSRATKDVGKGKGKRANELEQGLKWLMIREAKPDTVAHWQKVLDQVRAAEQAQQQENARASNDRAFAGRRQL